MDRKQEYAAVDIAKFFFCICILFIHTGAYHELEARKGVLYELLSLAVPFFFVASGYFEGCKIWTKDGISLEEKLMEYERKMFYPYIVFTGINTVFYIIELYLQGESFKWILIKLVRSFIFYPNGALWYIWASMTGMFLLYWFIKFDRMRAACLCGIVCFCGALLGNSYFFLLERVPLLQKAATLYLKIALTTRNGLFMGFPLLCLGVMMAKFRERIVGIKKAVYIGGIVLIGASILLYGEICLIESRNATYETALFFSQPIWVAALLILLLNCRWNGSRERMVMIRKLSTGIYFIHRPILTCLTYFFNFIGYNVNGIILFFILSFLSLGICYFVYKYRKEPFYSLLK